MLIPVVFVVLGLLIGYLVTNVGTEDTQDPLRALTLPNTAPSSNISLFWAQFGSTPSDTFNLQVKVLEQGENMTRDGLGKGIPKK